MNILDHCRDLRRDKHGAAAAIISLMVPVLLGGTALAVDVASYRMVHTRMQTAVDAAALAALQEIDTGGSLPTKAVATVVSNVPADFGTVTKATDVTTGVYTKAGGFVPAAGATVNAVRVIAERSPARGNGLRRIFSAVWGSEQVTVSVSAIAARPSNVFYEPPEGAILDNEAGDFNEMYAYCYNTAGAGDAASRRSQMTLIANNLPAGQNIVDISGGVISANPATPMPWPDCNQKGLSLSFRMRNIRHVKSNPQLWAKPNEKIDGRKPGRPESNYYTDTLLNDGVETFNSTAGAILETVRCDSSAKCDPKSAESTIPKGRMRTPSLTTQSCEPGKWMYFGWEDRNGSTNSGSWLDADWTDKDYDDIAIQMKCPRNGKLGDTAPRLVG